MVLIKKHFGFSVKPGWYHISWAIAISADLFIFDHEIELKLHKLVQHVHKATCFNFSVLDQKKFKI